MKPAGTKAPVKKVKKGAAVQPDPTLPHQIPNPQPLIPRPRAPALPPPDLGAMRLRRSCRSTSSRRGRGRPSRPCSPRQPPCAGAAWHAPRQRRRGPIRCRCARLHMHEPSGRGGSAPVHVRKAGGPFHPPPTTPPHPIPTPIPPSPTGGCEAERCGRVGVGRHAGPVVRAGLPLLEAGRAQVVAGPVRLAHVAGVPRHRRVHLGAAAVARDDVLVRICGAVQGGPRVSVDQETLCGRTDRVLTAPGCVVWSC